MSGEILRLANSASLRMTTYIGPQPGLAAPAGARILAIELLDVKFTGRQRLRPALLRSTGKIRLVGGIPAPLPQAGPQTSDCSLKTQPELAHQSPSAHCVAT